MPFTPLKKGKRLWPNYQVGLETLKRLPNNKQILDRLSVLQQLNNGCKKNKATVLVAKEVVACWQNQDIPVQSYQAINKRIKKLRKDVLLNDLFDVLPSNPVFKTSEDRKYYENQKVGVGYCSSKIISWNQHPSKRPRKNTQISNLNDFVTLDLSSKDESDEEVSLPSTSNLPISTKLATEVRQRANLSLSQTVAVFNVLHEHLKDERLKSPTRSSINKASNRNFSESSQNMSFSQLDGVLRFDGKCFVNLYGCKREMLAVCYDDKLIALKQLPNKRANTVAQFIINLLREKNLNPTIAVCDTEPTNTGKKNGVIVQIKKEYSSMIYEPCRLHVLDLVLKHQFFHYFPEATTGPNISYDFVNKLKDKWMELKNRYDESSSGELEMDDDLPNLEERRNDYKFLLLLVKALRVLRNTEIKPKIKIPNQPPSINQARWNSRASFSLMAELVGVGDERNFSVNTFIIEHWAVAWFGVRSAIDWYNLLNSNICDRAKAVIKKNIQNPIDLIPWTNEISERVFRMVNEKIIHSKTVQNLENAMLKYFNDISTRLN